MLRMIRHRGPYHQGAYFDEKKGLAMGHARLSIIDLKTGDQPIFSSDQKKVTTTNVHGSRLKIVEGKAF